MAGFVSVHKNAKKRTRPISSHLDRTSLVNKGLLYGFSFKLKLQKQNKTEKTEHETVLLGKKLFIAGQCKIYFQCILD